MRIRPGRIVVVPAAVAAVVAVGALTATLSFGGSDLVCRGVTVAGVEVGGIKRIEAERAVRAWSESRMRKSITLTALDVRWTGTAQDFGAKVDVRGASERAFRIGRDGSIIGRAASVLFPGGDQKRIEPRITFDEARVKDIIAGIARQVDKPHRDARLKAVEGRIEVEPDACGVRLNQEKAAKVVIRAATLGTPVVPLPVESDRPLVSAADARLVDTLLARYTTYFNPGKRERTHNLRLAADALNGMVLIPGQRFSYNDTVGPRLVSRGFKNAIIYVRGRLEEGVGGGICQVSSTLYNAVLLAGLNVVERSHHSRTVPYVPPGRDATVSYGIVDFRFENSNEAPIGLIASVRGSQLTVDVYGRAEEKRNIEIFSGKAAYVAHGRKTVVDSSIAPGTSKIRDEGATGVSVTIYRRITSGDGSSVTEVVSRNRYPMQNTIVAVGPVKSSAAPGVTTVEAAANAADSAAKIRSD